MAIESACPFLLSTKYRQAARSIALGILLLAITALLITMGIWQIQRLAWKNDLITRVNARVHAAPVPAPSPAEWPRFLASQEEYRQVHVRGVFQNDAETLVQAVTVFGGGFWVLTPLRTDDGFTVLINRGFVPADLKQAADRTFGQIAGQTIVSGVLRITEPRGAFLQANDSALDRWHSRDIAAIAASRGIGPAAPYFIDVDATPNQGGIPIGGLTIVAFANNHLVYALTWFTLATMLAITTVWIAFRAISCRRPQA